MEEQSKSSLDRLILVGDRVLIQPKTQTGRTKRGLYLPPGIQEKEEIQSGYVMKVGPGFPLPIPSDGSEETWKRTEEVKYLPLQAKVGDLALYLRKGSHEVDYFAKKYIIVPQSSILMLERDEELVQS